MTARLRDDFGVRHTIQALDRKRWNINVQTHAVIREHPSDVGCDV